MAARASAATPPSMPYAPAMRPNDWPARRGVAVRAARAVAVDREGGAAALEHHHDLAVAADAFALRGHARRIALGEVERVAVGRALADRHRARRLTGRNAQAKNGNTE